MKCKCKSFFTAFFICLSISVTAAAESVIPLGVAVGVAIKTDGLLVTGITEVTDENGHSVNAAYKAGIKKGDRIMAVDGNAVNSIEDLSEYVNDRPQEIIFSIIRKGEKIHKIITPVKTPAGYKIGVWVRDSTAGIGTLTYYNPESKTFAGLGHGISDIDTGDILTIKKGNILTCSLTEPIKGKKGIPGELCGTFTDKTLGEVSTNSENGIFGQITNAEITGTPLNIANPKEVTAGDAYIMSDVDGEGAKPYSVSIRKILSLSHETKNMIIEVTDQKLIDKTGGIVQGMSGSPIIKDGKLIGAVTHVFVNNPKQGYAVFAENMKG